MSLLVPLSFAETKINVEDIEKDNINYQYQQHSPLLKTQSPYGHEQFVHRYTNDPHDDGSGLTTYAIISSNHLGYNVSDMIFYRNVKCIYPLNVFDLI